jgi:hypothetical protein
MAANKQGKMVSLYQDTDPANSLQANFVSPWTKVESILREIDQLQDESHIE